MSGPARRYPRGVSCWVDTEQPDPVAASGFYGALFGWEFENAMPPGAPAVYLIATLQGSDVAAIGSASPEAGGAGWNTYFAVDDADADATAVVHAGGTLVSAPEDAGPGGRAAAGRDPLGAEFGLWQARRRLGAQRVNEPGSWNFSNLRSTDPAASKAYYAELFGWSYLDLGDTVEAMIAVDGYGDHLAATVDPGIFDRQAGAPAGFADVIGAVQRAADGETDHWEVVFSVASRAESLARAEGLGATVVSTVDTPWSLLARIRDPQGAELTLSEFRDPR
ncbi:VOC family protein [Herbiconiux moechotypicola]|uniref:VOC family protein n=1 Tax=Herbiconiux moechotypicola TaxID=637393 RepID=A0ABP5R258_9MICO|nr:VOC family protein [Herbiconiux moechotypicola]MCS5731955.1 VOC family protein [Herbiconiux moechotypicola]